jgi:putative ABC transport system substrate-binding protein
MRWIISLAAVAAFLMLPARAPAEDTVLVLSSADPACLAAAQGFKSAFPGKYREINLEGSDEKQRMVGQQLKASPPAVAVVVGDLAAQMAEWYLSGVPVVYCASSGAAKLSLTTGKTVGIYNETAPMDQLSAIASLFPERKRIGLIYSAEYAHLDEKGIADAARAKGITLELAPLGSIKELPEKLRALMPKVDLLWVFTDPVVLSSHSTQYIVLQSISAGLPIFCGDAGLAHGGATAALVPDPADAGAKAARETAGLLQGKAPAAAVIYPKGKLILNLKSASMLKVSFPDEAVASAGEVIK